MAPVRRIIGHVNIFAPPLRLALEIVRDGLSAAGKGRGSRLQVGPTPNDEKAYLRDRMSPWSIGIASLRRILNMISSEMNSLNTM